MTRTADQERALKKATRVRSKSGNHRAAEAPGEVAPGEVFTIDAFCRRRGITRTYLQDMKARGLKVRMDGPKYRLVTAEDYSEYANSLPTEDQQKASGIA